MQNWRLVDLSPATRIYKVELRSHKTPQLKLLTQRLFTPTDTTKNNAIRWRVHGVVKILLSHTNHPFLVWALCPTHTAGTAHTISKIPVTKSPLILLLPWQHLRNLPPLPPNDKHSALISSFFSYCMGQSCENFVSLLICGDTNKYTLIN